jgi:hypothetical protein
MWSHDVITTSLGLAVDLKLGQYLKVTVVSFENIGQGADRKKIPPRATFLSQILGTIVGMFPNQQC